VTALSVVALVGGILAVNGAVWAVLLVWMRRRAADQDARYGPLDETLADGTPTLEAKAWFGGTVVDGGRYFAAGHWLRGNGAARLTDAALVVRRHGVRRHVVVPRSAVTGIERTSSFAGRRVLREVVTVVHWEHGGGRFASGFVLGGDEETRGRFEEALRPPTTG